KRVKVGRAAADSSFEAYAALVLNRRSARADGLAQRVRLARDHRYATRDPGARRAAAPPGHRAAQRRGHAAAPVPDPLERAAEAPRDQAAARLLALDSRPRALPRQRVLPEGIARCGAPAPSPGAEDARGARDPLFAPPARREAARNRPRHRADRLRQVDRSEER